MLQHITKATVDTRARIATKNTRWFLVYWLWCFGQKHIDKAIEEQKIQQILQYGHFDWSCQ